MKHIVSMLAIAVAGVASAKDKPLPVEPTGHPDWAQVRATAESGLKSQLFDPGSAQITYTSGFQWGYTKPVIGGKRWGWVACGTMNAKNRLGGYVGAQPFVIRADVGGGVTWVSDGDDVGTCTGGARAELQPELKDQEEIAKAGDARLGVADELSKLAELRAKGVISQAEFDVQKTKLLAR